MLRLEGASTEHEQKGDEGSFLMMGESRARQRGLKSRISRYDKKQYPTDLGSRMEPGLSHFECPSFECVCRLKPGSPADKRGVRGHPDASY